MLSDMPHCQNGSQTLRNSLSKPETRGKSKTLVAVHFYAKKKWTLGRWIHVSEQYLPAINVLEPQVITPIPMDESPIINVYHHISILLSRGEDNIAVTGSNSGSLTAVFVADEDPSIENFTQNPNKNNGMKLVIKNVKPSGKPLQDLAIVR